MKNLALLFCLIASPLFAQAPNFADLADKVMPSVVTISSIIDGKEIVGSGFVVDETGLILTNHHVVDRASKIDVGLGSSQTFQATLKSGDEKLDLALLKIEPFELLTAIKFGDSEQVRVGEWVMAVGNPFGLGNSISSGIISAKSRDIDMGMYDNFLQTDAVINMGNSGGPLFNLNGEVIGITTAMFSETGKSSGVSFSLPSNQAKWAVEELNKNGKIKRGWIGIQIQPDNTQTKGVVISSFAENSPAIASGFEIGDVVLKFDDSEINSPKDLSRMVAATAIGKIARVQITRKNQSFIKELKISEMPPKPARVFEEEIDSCFALGMEINNKNLQIIDAEAGSDAEFKGLKQNDEIQAIDNKTMLNCANITSHILEIQREGKTSAMFKIIKDGVNTHFVEVKL